MISACSIWPHHIMVPAVIALVRLMDVDYSADSKQSDGNDCHNAGH